MLLTALRKLNKLHVKWLDFFDHVITRIIFRMMKVKATSFMTSGIPVVRVSNDGKMILGNNFNMNNGNRANLIGRQQKCFFIVGPDARLEIGKSVGISSTAFVCRKSIFIGDYVIIGGNTVIYDTDFHPIHPMERIASPDKYSPLIRNEPVLIEEHVFIGAHSTILKGVKIGAKSVIGAGSVVTKNVPSGEIWAGNPARFIKKMDGDFIE